MPLRRLRNQDRALKYRSEVEVTYRRVKVGDTFGHLAVIALIKGSRKIPATCRATCLLNSESCQKEWEGPRTQLLSGSKTACLGCQPVPPQTKTCLNCTAALNARKHLFCSKKCKNSFYHKQVHATRLFTPLFCDECKLPFMYSRGNFYFCSEDCRKSRRIQHIFKYNNGQTAEENNKRYRQSEKAKLAVMRRSIERDYGLSVEEYSVMLEAQKGLCKICKKVNIIKSRRLYVDHCHITGKVRALLCHNCNFAIGHLKEDSFVARRLADYLDYYGAINFGASFTQDTLYNVNEFHTIFKHPISDKPSIPDGPGTDLLFEAVETLMELRGKLRLVAKQDLRCMRTALIVEETAEFAEGLAKKDLIKTLDALGDMDYIDKGSALAFGLQKAYYPACSRIHHSNLSKLSNEGLPIYDDSGKIMKGPNYKPVDLSDLVDGSWLKAQEELEKL